MCYLALGVTGSQVSLLLSGARILYTHIRSPCIPTMWVLHTQHTQKSSSAIVIVCFGLQKLSVQSIHLLAILAIIKAFFENYRHI